MSDPLRVVLGYDSTEIAGVYTCIDSILKHASKPISFTLLARDTLRRDNLYWVDRGEDEATEFSRTRFLSPYLAGYRGQVAFLDGVDMIVKGDICELFSFASPGQDIAVVKLDYVPKSPYKFGTSGTQQRAYPYKLWSSVVVFNAYTKACERLTPKFVNEATGKELHQLDWIMPVGTHGPQASKELVISRRVGEIPEAWNWIVGHSEGRVPKEHAKLIHFTEGGVWHPGHIRTDIDREWEEAAQVLKY